MIDSDIHLGMGHRLPPGATERRRQTAKYSLWAAVAMSIVVIGVWWLTRPALTHMAVQRSITSMQVTWECPDGVTFVDRGSITGMTCPHSERRADVRVVYVCPRHGERPALVRYARGIDGWERVAEVSLRSGVWTPVGTSIRCPDCGTPLAPKEISPFLERPLPGSGEEESGAQE